LSGLVIKRRNIHIVVKKSRRYNGIAEFQIGVNAAGGTGIYYAVRGKFLNEQGTTNCGAYFADAAFQYRNILPFDFSHKEFIYPDFLFCKLSHCFAQKSYFFFHCSDYTNHNISIYVIEKYSLIGRRHSLSISLGSHSSIFLMTNSLVSRGFV